ncbi:MAG: DUF4143 domain-containing protein, partial [bacterium]
LAFSLLSFQRRLKQQMPFSKDLLYAYYKYFLESMLIMEARIFSPSAYKRQRNPAKIYLIDTGLTRRVTTQDTGRLLENAVFLEYRRCGMTLSYYAGRGECDFVARDHSDNLACCQVCHEMHETARPREIAGLVEACKSLGLKQGLIITSDEEGEEKSDDIAIRILPFWRWALEEAH